MLRRVLITIAVLTLGLWAATPPVPRPQMNTVAKSVSSTAVGAARAIAAVTIPRMLSYQGKLLDSSGTPVADTTYSILFRLFDVPTGGTAFWSETQTVRTRAGLFSVLLGLVTPLDSFPQTGTCYLNMKVGAAPALTPRIQIASAAYAFLASKADTANYALAGGSPGDNAWVHGGDSVLYTVRELGIARGGSGNVLYGSKQETQVNLGVGCTTGNSQSTESLMTVSGGYQNQACSSFATIGGGGYNQVSNTYSTVGGGFNNVVSGWGASVAGGLQNHAEIGNCQTVAGGLQNSVTGFYSTVGGGLRNSVTGFYATVGGGQQNSVTGNNATVSGGFGDTAVAEISGVASGFRNHAGTTWADSGAAVAGGMGNTASSRFSFVGGGTGNGAYDNYATVGGGVDNTAGGYEATISGGSGSAASGSWATVGGGALDSAWASNSFAVGLHSVVATGHDNSAAFNGQTTTASGQTRVGILSKASGSFTIDDPLDPQHKILNHYFVESPQMPNLYYGSVVIGTDGRADVALPDYFSALNRNPMVQLTGVGSSDVYLAEDVTGNHFVVGGKPGTKVYWTAMGERQDQSAEITRDLMPVEQPKTGGLAGHMLDDDLLLSTMAQLEAMGLGGKYHFRTAAARQRYEDMKRKLEERR